MSQRALHSQDRTLIPASLSLCSEPDEIEEPAYEEALKANNVKYTMHMYEGCNHGFRGSARSSISIRISGDN